MCSSDLGVLNEPIQALGGPCCMGSLSTPLTPFLTPRAAQFPWSEIDCPGRLHARIGVAQEKLALGSLAAALCADLVCRVCGAKPDRQDGTRARGMVAAMRIGARLQGESGTLIDAFVRPALAPT